MTEPFQRARKPEEKEVRRQAILAAARALMAEVGSVDLSLSELARRAGLSKANLYRYFESREEVLLQVWVEETRELSDHLRRILPPPAPGTTTPLAALVAAITEAFVARPRLGELTSVVSPILEPKLSSDAIVTAKLTLAVLMGEIAELLHAHLPRIPLEDCAWAAMTIGTWVAGAWPATHPADAVLEVLARPELAGFRLDFARDFARFLDVMFTGLKARTSS